MKRVIIFLTAFLILMGTVGCSSDETNARISENENKIKEVEKTANSIREELNKSIKTLEEGVKSAKQAQTALEEKVSQFEGLAQRVTELETTIVTAASKAELTRAKTEIQLELNSLTVGLNSLAEDIADVEEFTGTLASKEEVKTAVDGLTAALATANEKIAALEEGLAGVAANELVLAGLVQELATSLEELTGEFGTLKTQVTKLSADLADLAAFVEEQLLDINTDLAKKADDDDLEELAAKVDALADSAEDAISLTEYMNATSLLAGDAPEEFYEAQKEEESAWNEILNAIESKIGEIEFDVTSNPYSYNAWLDIQAKIAGLRELGTYPDSDQDDLEKKVESQKFFLGRDVTVEKVMERFASLAGIIAELPTKEEMFISHVNALDAITLATITEETDEYEEFVYLTETYADLKDLEPVDAEGFAAAAEKFEKLTAAKENLYAAKVLVDALAEAAADAKVTSDGNAFLKEENEHETYTNQLAAYEAIQDAFFGTEENDMSEITEWYPEGYSLDDLCEGLRELLEGRVDYIDALEDAAELLKAGVLPAFDETLAAYTFGDETFNKITADFTAVNKWATDNKVDADNRAYIYEQETEQAYAEAVAINAYAEGLQEIYTTLVVETEFAETVTPLQEETYVVEYANKDDIEGYADLFDDLYEAVYEFVTDEDTYEFAKAVATANYNAMLDEAEISEEKYDAVCGRLAELAELADLFAAELERIQAKWVGEEDGQYVVKLTDYNTFFDANNGTSVRAKLNAYYALYSDATGLGTYNNYNKEYNAVEKYDVKADPEVLTNNAAMSKEVETAYAAIAAAYNEMAKSLAEAVEHFNELFDNEDVANGMIRYANDLNEISFEIAYLILTYDIYDQEVHVKVEEDSEEETTVNFSELLDNTKVALTKVAENATAAQGDYEDQEDEIEAIAKILVAGKNEDGSLTEAQVEDGYVLLKLDDKAKVQAAYTGLCEWAVEYFGDLESVDDLLEAVAAVQTTNEYGKNEEGETVAVKEFEKYTVNSNAYTFYTSDEAEHIVELAKAYVEMEKAAKNEWDPADPEEGDPVLGLLDELVRLAGLAEIALEPAVYEYVYQPAEYTYVDEHGDYELIDDEYVAVEPDTGHYALVSEAVYGDYDLVDDEYVSNPGQGHYDLVEEEYEYVASYTYTIHDANAFKAAYDAYKAYVATYYRNFAEATKVFDEDEAIDAFNKVKGFFDGFMADAKDAADAINDLIDSVTGVAAKEISLSTLDVVYGDAMTLLELAEGKLDEIEDAIDAFNAKFDKMHAENEEDPCNEMIKDFFKEQNYEYFLKRTIYMCEAISLVRTAYNEKGVDFETLKALYDQFIRTYSYNLTLTPTKAALDNYFNTFASKVADEIAKVEPELLP